MNNYFKDRVSIYPRTRTWDIDYFLRMSTFQCGVTTEAYP